MLLQDFREMRKLAKAQAQPMIRYLSFSPDGVLADVRAAFFPDLMDSVAFHFVDRGPLAGIYPGNGAATIYVHQVLNHDQTPREVISLVCKHELLHLRIRPVETDGRWVQHPPAFWQAEKAICPERLPAWAWIWNNLDRCLRRRPEKERIDVRPSWRMAWNRAYADIETSVSVRGLAGREPDSEIW
jgi:hypothetical protein